MSKRNPGQHDGPEDGRPGAHRSVDAEVLRVIHQLNQPLTAISNYAQAGSHLIDNGLTDTERLKELFEKIVSQCSRTFTISRELNELLHRQDVASAD